jgi:hypothetical protein
MSDNPEVQDQEAKVREAIWRLRVAVDEVNNLEQLLGNIWPDEYMGGRYKFDWTGAGFYDLSEEEVDAEDKWGMGPGLRAYCDHVGRKAVRTLKEVDDTLASIYPPEGEDPSSEDAGGP